MQRIDIQKTDPVRYAKVKAQQDRLREQCEGTPTVIRVCPYCKHKIAEVVQGNHGFCFAKCERCAEDVIFPPVCFRMATVE